MAHIHKSRRTCDGFFVVFLDTSVRKKRKKFGGSGRKTFTEGWVEFKDKKIAKQVASSLNNTMIGTLQYYIITCGKKKSYYHDDIWNIKYLPRFLWGQLSEQIAFEKASREQRMRTEISQAKKDANFYIESVEKGKGFEAMEERKRKRNKEVITSMSTIFTLYAVLSMQFHIIITIDYKD
ncbi:hypothetical protein QZH41_015026 [Actinostola sp. cb2023]|nr:hypothetical protein QZH41_015026 [Actinostola sp. cb2023]